MLHPGIAAGSFLNHRAIGTDPLPVFRVVTGADELDRIGRIFPLPGNGRHGKYRLLACLFV